MLGIDCVYDWLCVYACVSWFRFTWKYSTKWLSDPFPLGLDKKCLHDVSQKPPLYKIAFLEPTNQNHAKHIKK